MPAMPVVTMRVVADAEVAAVRAKRPVRNSPRRLRRHLLPIRTLPLRAAAEDVADAGASAAACPSLPAAASVAVAAAAAAADSVSPDRCSNLVSTWCG